MAHLMVASDLSPRSERAVTRAIRLAARTRSRLTVVHVVDGAMPAYLANRLREDAEEHLSRFCAEQPGSEDASIDIEVRVGDPTDDLLAEADAADLVIAGVHRGRRLFDTLRETTVERLVLHGSAPVLLVRDPPESDYRCILAAIDGSPAASAAAGVARRIAPGAEMTAFYATEAGDPADVHRVIDAWSDIGGLPEGMDPPEVVPGAASDALRSMIQRVKPDLISLGAHSRGASERWTIGSLTSALVRDAPCDLVIARRAPPAS